MELIIISGPAKVGKTTLAKMIAGEAFELGFKPILLSFAGPLKEEAKLRGYDKENNPKEYREFCQVHGALKREIDPDYWVNVFEEKLKDLYKEEKKDLKDNKSYWQKCVVVDDCRYENELALGVVYKSTNIFLSPGDRQLDDSDGEWRQHHSEDLARRVEGGDEELCSLFNYIMDNSNDKDTFKMKTTVMIPMWLGLQTIPQHLDVLKTEEKIQELLDLFLMDYFDEEDEYDD